MWNQYSNRCKRSALTLIEVVSAIAILALLLTAILMSFRAHVRQIHTAQKRLTAIETADRLLTMWSEQGAMPQAGLQEKITDREGVYWRITEKNTSNNLPIPLRVLRLEIFEHTTGENIQVLAAVEVIDSIEELRQ